MRGVQRGRGRRGHPGGAGSRDRVLDLGLDHGRHLAGHRPHALADLGAALQPAGQPGVDVGDLVGAEPGRGLHLGLRDHRSGLHVGVDLVTGAVQEAGVDEHHPVPGPSDALLEPERRAALLVHDPHLESALHQAEGLLHPAEQLAGQGDFVGAVHLGLDDVDRTGRRVADGSAARPSHPPQIVERAQRGHHGVDHGLVDRFAAERHHVGGEMGPHIADQHQRAARQRDLRSVRRGEAAIAVQRPVHGRAVAHERGLQRAPHQSQPVPVDRHLVVGVHRRHGVLEVHDRGNGGLEADVEDAGVVPAAHGVVTVDAQLAVKAVLAQQDRSGRVRGAGVADELLGTQQRAHGAVPAAHPQHSVLREIAGRPPVARRVEREVRVEELAPRSHHPVAPDRVVGVAAAAAVGLADHVGPVESVVQAPPAGVGRVERIAGIVDGDHQLRPGHLCDLGIDIGGRGGDRAVHVAQVPDVAQEVGVGVTVAAPSVGARRSMPVVDPGLQLVAAGHQSGVAGPEVGQDGLESAPELVDVHAGSRQGLDRDEFV